VCDVTGANDGSCVREAVETQEASRDAVEDVETQEASRDAAEDPGQRSEQRRC